MQWFLKALEIRISKLGEVHIEVLTALENIGEAHYALEQYPEAISHIERALIIRHKVQCEKQETIIKYEFLATNYRKLGNEKKALENFEKALAMLQELGDENFSLGKAFNNVGVSLLNLADYEKAIPYLEKGLAIIATKEGEQQERVAICYDNLAEAFSQWGKYEEAVEHREKALSIRRSVHGENHALTATSYDNAAWSYDDLGNHQKALECGMRALEIRRELLGENHLDTALSYNNTSYTLAKLGDYQKGLEQRRVALKIRESILGQQHPMVIRNTFVIAWYQAKLGHYIEAKANLEKNMAICKSINNVEGEQEACLYLAFTYTKLGQFQDALGFAEKALSLTELAPRDRIDFQLQHTLVQHRLKIADCLENSQKTLKASLTHFGSQHATTAKAYNLRGLILVFNGDRQGLEFLEKGLNIRQNLVRLKLIDLAESYYCLGLAHQEFKNYEKAIEYYLQALTIQQKDMGDDHPDVADTLHSMGAVYTLLDQKEQALHHFEKALAIRLKSLGEGFAPTVESYYTLGKHLAKLEQYARGLEYQQKAVMLACTVYKNNHPLLIAYMQQLMIQMENVEDDSLLNRVYMAIRWECVTILGEEHKAIIALDEKRQTKEKCLLM